MKKPRTIRNQIPLAKRRARKLRQESGVSEQVLWRVLRGNKEGFKFRRQVPIGQYVLDFYCHEAKLCVELDGEHHAERFFEEGLRDDFLRVHGIETLRFNTLALFDEEHDGLTPCISAIIKTCEARSGRKA